MGRVVQVRVVTDSLPKRGNDRIGNAAAIPNRQGGDAGESPHQPPHDHITPEPASGHPTALVAKPVGLLCHLSDMALGAHITIIITSAV